MNEKSLRIERRKADKPKIETPAEVEPVSIERLEEITNAEAEKRDSGLEKIRRTIGKKNEKNHLDGDFAGYPKTEGQIQLSASETAYLKQPLSEFFENIKDSKVATTSGYKVAGVYDTQVQGWTTQSRILTLEDGKKPFVLCSYPKGSKRRTTDRLMEKLSGDPMRKPRPEDWKKIVESRSNIPTIAGMPENMVAMPFIESINSYDIFQHQKDIEDFGPFDWAEKMTVTDKLDLLPEIVQQIYIAHEAGMTWGEAILQNVILTKEKKAILIDPETTYENIPFLDQRATDLRNIITSVYGTLTRTEAAVDISEVISRIISAYPNHEVVSRLKQMSAEPLSVRQRFFFNLFSRYRNGASDLKEFDLVMESIVSTLS